MSRLRSQAGMTMVEMLVGMALSLAIFGSVLGLLEVFMRNNTLDQTRNELQDRARSTVGILTRQLRNVAAPSASSAGALELAGPYDLVFQTVDSTPGANWGSNVYNQIRVRYCLSTSGSGASTSNAILWRQEQTWNTSATPAVPSTTACPGSGWSSTAPYANYQAVNYITNVMNAQNRPVFTYAPIGSTSSNQINDVEVDLFMDPNPGKPPGETELKTGIYLRNDFASPIASFYVTQPNGQIILDASASTDPNGQALSYQWAVNGTTVPGATTQQYVAGAAGTSPFTHGANVTFTLTVTSTGGLSTTTSQTVKIT